MVERKESTGMNEYKGKVVEVESGVTSNYSDSEQFHIIIEPVGFTVAGKTGKMHEYIALSKTSSNDAIAKGSVMDMYLRELERVLPEAKKAATVEDALRLMVGKTFKFEKMELGRGYQGNAPREYSVPTKLEK